MIKLAVDLNCMYIKSKYLQTIVEGDYVAVWHSLFGLPKIISTDTLTFLNSFSEPATISSKIDEESIDDISPISELIECFYLVKDDFDERSFLNNKISSRASEIRNGSMINYLELIMCELCNFRCTYCIHFNNLEHTTREKNPNKFMEFSIAKKAVDEYLKILRLHHKREAQINFGGGEPLLAWPVINQVIKYCRTKYWFEFEFRFSINTNASLITERIAHTLKQYKFDIASSLDGLEKMNDCVRLDKAGKGTFSNIIKGFNVLDKVRYPLDGIAVTITDKNFYELDETMIDWAKSRGMNNVRIDIDIIGAVDIPICDIVSKFLRLRKYAKSLGIDMPGFWLRPAENLINSTFENHVSFCGGTRGSSMCVNPAGEIYSCGYSTNKLGEIQTVFPNDDYCNFVMDRQTGKVRMCYGCMIEGQCNGGCNITQEYANRSSESSIERMCDFYRIVTQEVIREQIQELFLGLNQSMEGGEIHEAEYS